LAAAQYNLGVCYRDGEGVGKDEEEAAIWFRKAADQNLALAQYNLGVCYDNGQGVAKDSLKAVKWYRKAADQNLAYAQCNLGAHYEHGVGVQEDLVEAVRLYSNAAEQHYALAQYNLAACYASGKGVAQDSVEAVKWYRLAAEQDNALAECNLGICYANGQGVAKDELEAVKWFHKAANQNDSLAQYNLGIIYYNGYGVAQNETEAYIWFSFAAAQGDADASQSRNIIASHLSQADIAAAQTRIVSFRPQIKKTEQTSADFSYTGLLNQLGSWPLPEEKDQHGENPSHKDNTLRPQPAAGQDYFTIGSTRDEVIAVQGQPTSFNDNYLNYGMSVVTFLDGKVVNWNISDVLLKARYLNATNINPDQHPLKFSANVTPAQQSQTANQNPVSAIYFNSQESKPASVTIQQPEQSQSHGVAFMDTFLGQSNFCIASDDVISMKTGTLKFQMNGTTYDYSGNYAVMLTTPRKHRNPSFGFGTPDKAKLIIIDDFGGDAMPLPDATIWERSSGFIDAEALGKEWIYSGNYTIQK
jgi:TPR repeat protein